MTGALFEVNDSTSDVIKIHDSDRSRAESSNLSTGGDSLMGSGSEDEDEDGSAHHHHGGVGGPHLGPHNLGPGGPGDQTVGHTGDLPLGSDPCKQEDSEDQGRSTLLSTITVTFNVFPFFLFFFYTNFIHIYLS